MKNLLMFLVKPQGGFARILFFASLAAIALLGMTGHLELVRQYLETPALTFSTGTFSITAYDALREMFTVILIFWGVAIITDFVDSYLARISRMRAATRTLLSKVFQIGIYIVALLMTLDVLGINIQTLTVFSGALGIGLGFGLQKIASNFISGIILLLERSVEQNNLIELADGTIGRVRRARARFTLIETSDGREILVPNEDFITNRVINWTFSNKKARVEIEVGVGYDSDLEQVRALMLEAARAHPACMPDPQPVCLLHDFGDNAVIFRLYFWIKDVTTGRAGPRSDVMFALWDKFKQHNIEIPFPQRDVYLKSMPPPKAPVSRRKTGGENSFSRKRKTS